MNEKQQNFFDAGWVFTFTLGFIIKLTFPDLGGIPALLITLTPMLILLIFSHQRMPKRQKIRSDGV